MGQTGGASVASGLLSLLATKIVAVTAGPAHLAMLATLQQWRQAGVIAGSLAGQSALVQGASSRPVQNRRAYLRTVAVLMSMATLLAVAPLLFAPQWVSQFAGAPLPPALAAVIVVGVAFVFLTCVLNITGAIGSLALVQLAGPAAMALAAYPAARAGWLVELVAFSAFAALAAVAWALRGQDIFGQGTWWNRVEARRFVTAAGSLLASGLFANWALIFVRARVLRAQGATAGGEFDAAWAISMNQAGLMLASMQSFYLPDLARSRDAGERAAHIERVLTVAALVSAAVIVILAAAKPLVLTALYSDEFRGAARYLRWTLAGDYLKITSWIVSIPLVASAQWSAFLGADLAAYGAYVVAAMTLNRWWTAAESASMAFVVMYAVHVTICGACLWTRDGFRPRLRTVGVWTGGLVAIVSASALFWRQQ
jgi:O-antigen/teichoic acid export membrane protein